MRNLWHEKVFRSGKTEAKINGNIGKNVYKLRLDDVSSLALDRN